MDSKSNGGGAAAPPSETKALPALEIRIVFDPATGAVYYDGPTNAPVVFLGMLDTARALYTQQLTVKPPEKPLVEQASSVADIAAARRKM